MTQRSQFPQQDVGMRLGLLEPGEVAGGGLADVGAGGQAFGFERQHDGAQAGAGVGVKVGDVCHVVVLHRCPLVMVGCRILIVTGRMPRFCQPLTAFIPAGLTRRLPFPPGLAPFVWDLLVLFGALCAAGLPGWPHFFWSVGSVSRGE